MIDLNTLLRQRRSIRKYKETPPPEAWIESLIEAAAWSPSPRNTQPVRFIRLESAASRQNLQMAMLEGKELLLTKAAVCNRPKHLRNWINAYWRYSAFMLQAPVLFAVGTVKPEGGFAHELRQSGIKTPQKRDDADGDITLGLSLQGFMLQAQELGLGTCILTAPLAFIKTMDKITGAKEIAVKCLVAVGFADEDPPPPPRNPLDYIYRRI